MEIGVNDLFCCGVKKVYLNLVINLNFSWKLKENDALSEIYNIILLLDISIHIIYTLMWCSHVVTSSARHGFEITFLYYYTINIHRVDTLKGNNHTEFTIQIYLYKLNDHTARLRAFSKDLITKLFLQKKSLPYINSSMIKFRQAKIKVIW